MLFPWVFPKSLLNSIRLSEAFPNYSVMIATPSHFLLFEMRSHYVAQAGLKLKILLPQSPHCWDYRLPACPLSNSNSYSLLYFSLRGYQTHFLVFGAYLYSHSEGPGLGENAGW
jgi:hypothetical protein